MGYIGNQTSNSYSSMDKQTITGNGGTSYTLTHAVANAQEIEVFVNNVRQEAGVAYTVSGTALTMTGNVASTDDFYVIYQGKALQSVVPPDGSVTNAKIDTMAATKLTGTLDAARLSAGSVVQTQTALFLAGNAHISVASQTATQMTNANCGNVQVSITPKFNNSKILVTLTSSMTFYQSGNEYTWELHRDSTPIVQYSGDHAVPNYYGWVYFYDGSSGTISNYHPVTAQHTDTPSTTSQVTYKGFHRGGNNSNTAHACHLGGQMLMIATEIKV